MNCVTKRIRLSVYTWTLFNLYFILSLTYIYLMFDVLWTSSLLMYGNAFCRFTLNFKCGEENNFHFNPRPNQGCVVYNHNQHGWGTEERHQNPFHPGQPFELCITIEPNQYKVIDSKLLNGYRDKFFNLLSIDSEFDRIWWLRLNLHASLLYILQIYYWDDRTHV